MEPGPEVETNRGYGPRPPRQRLLVGRGGSAHSREGLVPQSGGCALPAHLSAHRLSPSFLSAGARARAREHRHSHTGVRACAQHSPTARPKLPFPLGGPDAQVAERGRGRSQEEEKKKMPPTLKIFYPLIFPITHWEVCSGPPESLPISEVPTTTPAKPATGP